MYLFRSVRYCIGSTASSVSGFTLASNGIFGGNGYKRRSLGLYKINAIRVSGCGTYSRWQDLLFIALVIASWLQHTADSLSPVIDVSTMYNIQGWIVDLVEVFALQLWSATYCTQDYKLHNYHLRLFESFERHHSTLKSILTLKRAEYRFVSFAMRAVSSYCEWPSSPSASVRRRCGIGSSSVSPRPICCPSRQPTIVLHGKYCKQNRMETSSNNSYWPRLRLWYVFRNTTRIILQSSSRQPGSTDTNPMLILQWSLYVACQANRSPNERIYAVGDTPMNNCWPIDTLVCLQNIRRYRCCPSARVVSRTIRVHTHLVSFGAPRHVHMLESCSTPKLSQ